MTLNLENYTRTDNPDGSILLVPIKEPVKVSKRFVPKVGEKFWYVSDNVSAEDTTWDAYSTYIGYLALGNVYRTEAEATKALDKQLALARIQNYIADNDLGKEFVEGEANYTIRYDHKDKCFDYTFWHSLQEYNPLGYLKSQEACTQVIENCKEDLLEVFGKV